MGIIFSLGGELWGGGGGGVRGRPGDGPSPIADSSEFVVPVGTHQRFMLIMDEEGALSLVMDYEAAHISQDHTDLRPTNSLLGMQQKQKSL